MKKLIVSILLFFVSIPAFDAILPAHNLLYAEGEDRGQKIEVGLGLGTLLEDTGCSSPIVTLTNIGFYVVRDVIQIEANVASECGEIIFSGNVSFNFPTKQRVTPFGTIGLGTCQHPWLFLNFGGGAKIRLTDRMGIRTEYRRWMAPEYTSRGTILCGVYFFF